MKVESQRPPQGGRYSMRYFTPQVWGAGHAPEEFPIYRELRAQGATDYLATPLIFTDGSVHVATWSTQQAGGFTDAQLAGTETIVRPFARVAEIRALQRTATNLLDAYVGHHAGERILAGQIRRGDTETIQSVIWLSDMRGFTALADRLPPQSCLRKNSQQRTRCESNACAMTPDHFSKGRGDSAGLLLVAAVRPVSWGEIVKHRSFTSAMRSSCS